MGLIKIEAYPLRLARKYVGRGESNSFKFPLHPFPFLTQAKSQQILGRKKMMIKKRRLGSNLTTCDKLRKPYNPPLNQEPLFYSWRNDANNFLSTSSNPNGNSIGTSRKPFPSPILAMKASIYPSRNTTCSTCSPTPAELDFTWGTRKATPPRISSRDTSG